MGYVDVTITEPAISHWSEWARRTKARVCSKIIPHIQEDPPPSREVNPCRYTFHCFPDNPLLVSGALWQLSQTRILAPTGNLIRSHAQHLAMLAGQSTASQFRSQR